MRRPILKPLAACIVMTAGLLSCASSPPERFTRTADAFTPCASAPHCVSSQAPADSAKHVAPFAFTGSADDARQALLKTLYANANATVVRADDRFIHATFSTTLGFVDDVTFLVAPRTQIIDVKSSSRIGYYDFGVNRKRVERLRLRFQELLSRA